MRDATTAMLLTHRLLVRPPASAGTALILAILISLAHSGVGYAAPGDLDRSFSGDGKRTIDFGRYDSASEVLIQPDGKVVVVGGTAPRADRDGRLAVVRLNGDGSLDSTFGGDGKVETNLPGSADYPVDAALQSDGRLVVLVGRYFGEESGTSAYALVRYLPSGTRDRGFGSRGVVSGAFGQDGEATALDLQRTGKILVTGRGYEGRTLIDRFRVDGRRDRTFGRDGRVNSTLIGEAPDGLLAVQADDKILVAGSVYVDEYNIPIRVVRYLPNGRPDKTFGVNGRSTLKFADAYPVDLLDMLVQADGRIVISGDSSDIGEGDSGGDFLLVRFRRDGSRDRSCGVDGAVTTDMGGNDDQGVALAQQLDGKLLLAGPAGGVEEGVSDFDFGIARYTPDCALDRGFGGDGKVRTHFTLDELGYGVAIAPDDRIVVVGERTTYEGGYSYPREETFADFAVARYDNCVRRLWSPWRPCSRR